MPTPKTFRFFIMRPQRGAAEESRWASLGFCMRAMSILLLSLGAMVAGAQELDTSCVAAINNRFHSWRLAPVTDEVREWASRISENPVLVGGDFDGDGTQDSAALIQARREADRAEVPKIALCLRDGQHVKLLTIDQPYCHDCIVPERKGTKVQEVDSDLIVTLPADGLTAVCYEHASAVYFVDKGQVREIVNGD